MATWRPKLTPYRSLVLFNTIGLGSVKAYATFRKWEFVATTIEWIAGVVLFSIIFVLSAYESNPPHLLADFFQQDLARSPFRQLICCTTHDSSDYDIIIGHTDVDITEAHPFVTGYRLLVTATVTSFGLVKYYFAYHGFVQQASAIEWILGVMLTSCLYVLGLYEDNPNGLMPYMFFFDFAPLLLTTLVLAAHILGLSLSCTWVAFSFITWRFFPFPDVRDVFNGTNKHHSAHQAPTTVFQGIHNLAHCAVIFLGCILFSSVGVLTVFGVIVRLFEESRGVVWTKAVYEIIWKFFLAYLARSVQMVATVLPVYKCRRLARFLRRFSLHILVYSAAILIAGAIAIDYVVAISTRWYEDSSSSILFACYITIDSLFPLFIICLLGFLGCIMLISPFIVDWEAPEYQRTSLELG